MSTDAVRVVKEFERRFMEGDMERVLPLISPDIVIHEAPSLPYGGVHEGRQGWRGLADAFNSTWRPTAPINCEYLSCGDGVACVLVELPVEARSTGRHLVLKIAEFHHVSAGMITRTDIYYWDTAGMLEALAEIED